MSYYINHQHRILNNIFSLLRKEDVLSRTQNNYEEFSVLSFTPDIDSLVKQNYIAQSDRQNVLVTMAIMYVNMCLAHARCHLTSNDRENYLVYFRIQDFDSDSGFAWTEVLYTRHANKVHLEHKSNKIDIQDCEVYDEIKHVIGLSDFICYYNEGKDSSDRYYAFVPKSLSHLIV